MARATKARSFKFRQAVDVRFETVPFKPFQSIRTLDLERLARARRAVVELGQFELDCCKRTARAVIQYGRVTAIELDACRDRAAKSGRVSREFARLFARAHAKSKRSSGGGLRLPMPVTRFFRRKAVGDVDITIDIQGEFTCYRVCVSLPGVLACGYCCVSSDGVATCFGMAFD
jgi:hypothetical protein